MRGVPLLTLLFAVLSLVFLVLLAFLRTPFPPYPLMSWQDLLDLLTPVALIPVYWLLYRHGTSRTPGGAAALVFILFAVLWVLGHGMHLSANSIHNLADAQARRGELEIRPTDLYRLIYFYDEHLSHPVWFAGMLGLAGVLIHVEARAASGAATVWWIAVVAGIVYGFTFFCIFLEGQTIYLGLPFVAVVAALTLIRGRRALGERPVAAFFGVASLVALLLFAGWGLYWRGFPQFTDVGIM